MKGLVFDTENRIQLKDFGEGFVDGERDFVSLTEDDKTNLILLLFALGISIKDESEAE